MPPAHPLFKAVLKRAATKKSRNDLIHAEEGEDRFVDLCAVGESVGVCCAEWAPAPSPPPWLPSFPSSPTSPTPKSVS